MKSIFNYKLLFCALSVTYNAVNAMMTSDVDSVAIANQNDDRFTPVPAVNFVDTTNDRQNESEIPTSAKALLSEKWKETSENLANGSKILLNTIKEALNSTEISPEQKKIAQELELLVKENQRLNEELKNFIEVSKAVENLKKEETAENESKKLDLEDDDSVNADADAALNLEDNVANEASNINPEEDENRREFFDEEAAQLKKKAEEIKRVQEIFNLCETEDQLDANYATVVRNLKVLSKEEVDQLYNARAKEIENSKKDAETLKKIADRVAAEEKAAKEEAEAKAAQQKAKEEADRVAAEDKAAKEEADRRAAEDKAKEEADRVAAEDKAKEEAKVAEEKAEADRKAAELLAQQKAKEEAEAKAKAEAEAEAKRLAAEEKAAEEKAAEENSQSTSEIAQAQMEFINQFKKALDGVTTKEEATQLLNECIKNYNQTFAANASHEIIDDIRKFADGKIAQLKVAEEAERVAVEAAEKAAAELLVQQQAAAPASSPAKKPASSRRR